MKRILLTISTLLALSIGTSNAQWVRNPASGTSTGMSFSGGTAVTATVGEWGGYTPVYTDATCNTYASMYWGGANGNSGAPKDSTNQVAYTMVTVANGGDNNGAGQGTAGWAASPSFSVAMNGGSNLDLSNTAHRTLSFRARSTVAFKAELLLMTTGYAPVNNNWPKPYVNILGDNQFHVYTINFDTSIVSTAINSIFNMSFLYNSSTPISGRLFISDFAVGSATPITAGVNDAAAMIGSSKLYPNPVSDEANVELNLKSSSAVKVTLSDLMGKEVMTIADGTFSTLNKSFSVAGLNKGIYTVNYFINGAAAKAEMLMVK